MQRERTARQPAGPGRPTRRTRTPRSATSASEEQASSAATPASVPRFGGLSERLGKGRFRDIGFTRRALVLVGVFAVLALPYANSLRVLLNQQREIAITTAQIDERTAKVVELEAELQRWRDPAYVKSQARSQLGWVLPGETGFRVIGLDGKVILDAAESTGLSSAAAADQTRWWDRLAGSVQAADAGKAAAKG